MYRHRLSPIAIVLSLILALALAACGTPATTTPAATAAATAASAETATVAPTAAGEAVATDTSAAADAATPQAAAEGEGVEPNNTLDQAADLAVGVTADYLAAGDEDWFKIAVPNGAELAVTMTTGADAEGLFVVLSDPDQNEVWSEYDLGAMRTVATTLLMNATSGDDYYLQVGGGSGIYALEIAFTAQQDGPAGSTGDAADALGSALAVPMASALSGRLGDYDSADWYTFPVEAGSVLAVSVTTGADADGLAVAVLDPDQNEVWSEYDLGPNTSKDYSQTVSASAGGNYYLQVMGGSGSYSVQIGSAKQDDAASGDDAGDSLGRAVAVEAGTYSGQIGDTDSEDWYASDVAAAQVLSVSFKVQAGADAMNVEVLDPDQNVIWSEYDVQAGKTVSTSYTIGNDAGGAFYVHVFGGKGTYSFTIGAAGQDDAGSGGDAADEIGGALQLDAGTSYSGLLGDTDGADWYTVAMPDSGSLTVTLERGDSEDSGNVFLYDVDQNEVWSEYDVAGNATATTTVEGEAGATYYIEVSGGSGAYTLTVE